MLNKYIIITLSGAIYYSFIVQFQTSQLMPNLMLLVLFFLAIFSLNNNLFELTLISIYTLFFISQIQILQPLTTILGGLAAPYTIFYLQKKIFRKIHSIYIILAALLFFLIINLNFFLAEKVNFTFEKIIKTTLTDSAIAFAIFLIYIFVNRYAKTQRKIHRNKPDY